MGDLKGMISECRSFLACDTKIKSNKNSDWQLTNFRGKKDIF